MRPSRSTRGSGDVAAGNAIASGPTLREIPELRGVDGRDNAETDTADTVPCVSWDWSEAVDPVTGETYHYKFDEDRAEYYYYDLHKRRATWTYPSPAAGAAGAAGSVVLAETSVDENGLTNGGEYEHDDRRETQDSSAHASVPASVPGKRPR